MKQRYRRISPMEWAYLGAASHFPPFAIQLFIEADTLPSYSELERALNEAANANPGARLIKSGKWWYDSEIAPRLRELSNIKELDLDHPIFREPFKFDQHPPIELILCQGAGLLFRCSHALMDARGLLFFAEETFRALRGEVLLGTSAIVSDRAQILKAKHSKRRGWPKPNASSPLGVPTERDSGFVWQRRTLAGDADAISARIAAAISELTLEKNKDGVARLMLPVDLRPKTHVRSTVNLSNPLLFELNTPSTSTDFYRDILQALANNNEFSTEKVDDLLPIVPLSVVGKILQYSQNSQIKNNKYYFSSTISHMGYVSLSAFSTETFSPRAISLLPFDMPGCALMLITVQHENGIEISASAPAVFGEALLSKALDHICSQISGHETFTLAKPSPNKPANTYAPHAGPARSWPAKTINDVLREAIEQFGSNIALSDQNLSFTCSALNSEIERYIKQLSTMGIRTGNHVAILADRTPATVTAVLAVLRSGAVFIPMDVEWPDERIHFVLTDCKPVCVITEEKYIARISGIPALILDDEKPTAEHTQITSKITDPQSPAYILYTSGSTGQPKGVVVGHASLLNYVMWAKDYYFQEHDDRIVFPLFTSLAFDLTLTAIFLPLVTGGEIRVFKEANPLLAIKAILADTSINSIKLTPSHLRLFSELGIQDSELSTFIVGGEALATPLAKAITDQSQNRARIFNEYGPTEATVGCIVHRYNPMIDNDDTVPIGRPIANTEILILGDDREGLADGVVGEIYIAGDCLALGYLNHPEESKRFLPHPLRTNELMYRTGDFGLVNTDGNFIYRGRVDDQIKIRGNRVELGEIEGAILSSGLCKDAAVLFDQTTTNGLLIAAVCWKSQDIHNAEKLQHYLKNKLPRYSIPAQIISIDRLPLTKNGKVDKSVLNKSVALNAPLESIVGETDELETQIIWEAAAVLELPTHSLSVESSLNELGCDSLKMAMLLSRCANKFLPVQLQQKLFEQLNEFLNTPTPRRLAESLRRLLADNPKRPTDENMDKVTE